MGIDMGKLLKGMAEYDKKCVHAVEVYGRSAAHKMVACAKQNKPWQDRTGMAWQTLSAVAEWKGDKFISGVQHGVYYGVYLEYAHQKRFAILEPTMNKMAPEVYRGLARILSK